MLKSTSKSIHKLVCNKNLLIIAGVLLTAIIGIILFLHAQAAVPVVSFEPENGTVTSPATKIIDSSASHGSAVMYGSGSVAPDNEFSFAAIGDTQQEVIYDSNLASLLVPGTTIHMNQYFNQRLQYLVDNKARFNLKYVWQNGDLQNWDTDTHDQYVRASNGLKILEKAGIPYALTNGNHDNLATGAGGSARDSTKTKEYFRTVDTWNSFYPASRFPGIKTLCSEFPQFNTRLMAAFPVGMAATDINHPQYVKNECTKSDTTVNAYRTFTAGGLNWILINYEMWPRQVVQEWMKTVLERYPNYNAILLTHYNIDYGGGLSTSGSYGSPQGAPSMVFDNIIKQYANIKFVSSGHVSSTGFCSTAIGVHGNLIHNYLNDRLSGQDEPNYFRLIKINVAARTITTEHIMPNTAAVQQAKLPAIQAACNETNVTWMR